MGVAIQSRQVLSNSEGVPSVVLLWSSPSGTTGAEESSSASRHFRNTILQHRWPPFLYFFCTPAIRGPPLPRSVLKATSPALSAFRQALSR